MPMVRI